MRLDVVEEDEEGDLAVVPKALGLAVVVAVFDLSSLRLTDLMWRRNVRRRVLNNLGLVRVMQPDCSVRSRQELMSMGPASISTF